MCHVTLPPQDELHAPASATSAAAASDELPAQGSGWNPVEEDALEEQVCGLVCSASAAVAAGTADAVSC